VTSYVIVDDRPDAPRAEIPAQLRRTPIAMTQRWHGMMGSFTANAASADLCHLVDVGQAWGGGDMEASLVGGPPTPQHFSRSLSRAVKLDRRDAPDPDREILLQQCADGSWKLDKKLAKWAKVDLKLLKKLAKQLAGDEREAIVATLLVLHQLEARTEDVPDSWQPALEKARAWLQTVTADATTPDGSEWPIWFSHAV
jgi:hypothetical protein